MVVRGSAPATPAFNLGYSEMTPSPSHNMVMDNIEAINYRGPAVTGMPFSRWKEVRLAFLYAILHSLRRVRIYA